MASLFHSSLVSVGRQLPPPLSSPLSRASSPSPSPSPTPPLQSLHWRVGQHTTTTTPSLPLGLPLPLPLTATVAPSLLSWLEVREDIARWCLARIKQLQNLRHVYSICKGRLETQVNVQIYIRSTHTVVFLCSQQMCFLYHMQLTDCYTFTTPRWLVGWY